MDDHSAGLPPRPLARAPRRGPAVPAAAQCAPNQALPNQTIMGQHSDSLGQAAGKSARARPGTESAALHSSPRPAQAGATRSSRSAGDLRHGQPPSPGHRDTPSPPPYLARGGNRYCSRRRHGQPLTVAAASESDTPSPPPYLARGSAVPKSTAKEGEGGSEIEE